MQNKYSHFLFPSVTVYDFDYNGLPDILYSGGKRNFLYLNLGNGRFQEAAKEFGIACDGDTEDLNSQIIMADFNGDGADDIYLATTGKHRFFIRDKNKNHFTEQSKKLNGYASFSHGINVLDFNQDGLLDIVVANFYELGTEYRRVLYDVGKGEITRFGATNNLLIQNKNGYFVKDKEFGALKKTMTNAVGISDINSDGFPDVFFANDYGPDQLLLNINGKTIEDVTKKLMPKDSELYGGKSGEFIDFDQDGLIDLFETNAFIPPYQLGYNMLWKKTSPDGHFKLVSLGENIGKSGISWGAKFADFNLDGKLDVYVANGLIRDEREQSVKDEKSSWYEKMEFSKIPSFFRMNKRMFNPDNSIPHHTFGFERDSLFIQGDNGVFYDVAADIGLNNDREGRGLAIADLNNDGLMDIIVTNYFGPSKVYLNECTPGTSWIGFTLYDKRGSRLPIGAKIRLSQTHGPDLVREYYPANGHRSQSDHRLLFSLTPGSRFKKLEIRWPSKTTNTYINLKEKTYNDIYEK